MVTASVTDASAFAMTVMGASAGGFQALRQILGVLPLDYETPILVVRHQSPDADDYVVRALGRETPLRVGFAEQGQRPEQGHVYLAPPDRHLLVDDGGCLCLTDGPPIHFSRPAIDPLFLSSARFYRRQLLAVVLTGGNQDGAAGAAEVKRLGGTLVVQHPESAEAARMPREALALTEPDYLVWLSQIGPLLWDLNRQARPADAIDGPGG